MICTFTCWRHKVVRITIPAFIHMILTRPFVGLCTIADKNLGEVTSSSLWPFPHTVKKHFLMKHVYMYLATQWWTCYGSLRYVIVFILGRHAECKISFVIKSLWTGIKSLYYSYTSLTILFGKNFRLIDRVCNTLWSQ